MSSSPNPDVDQLGPGPEGCRCGECANLAATRVPTRVLHTMDGDEANAYHVQEEQTVYYCLVTGQAKRVTWPACSRFEKAELATKT